MNGQWFLPALTLMFIGLKLTGFIAWSWWWVLSPILLPFGALGALFLIVLLLQAFSGR